MRTVISVIIVLALDVTDAIKVTAATSTQPRKLLSRPTSSRDDHVVERVDSITKSPNDKRHYRGLTLSNQLRVLLISDPHTTESAACMVVGVGALNDPRDVPGLANLVGYLLMMGARKYTGIYNFQKYLRRHEGICYLPKTKIRDQIFSFEVDPSLFAGTLDRFAQFFLEPTLSYEFDESMLSTSVNHIRRDHKSCKENDDSRIFEVEKSLSNKKSLYNHFFFGNEDTLLEFAKDSPEKLNLLYEKAKHFQSFYYSSNLMSLVVLGKESLNRLEEIVVPLFATIRNTGRTQITFNYQNHPYGPDQLKHKIYVVPIENAYYMRLSFPVPDVRASYKSAPDAFMSYYLTSGEHEGSLINVLRNRNLCINLKPQWVNAAGISFFVISCQLIEPVSEDGVNKIIRLIFEYMHILKANGLPKWISNEMAVLRSMSFSHGYEMDSPISHVQSLASELRIYPFKDILSHAYQTNEWDPDLINHLLEYVSPEKMNVTIVSPTFAAMKDLQEEANCGAKYKVELIPESLLKDWSDTRRLDPRLKFPQPNEFVPTYTDASLEVENTQVWSIPRLLHESSKSEIWFKQDFKLEVPKLWVKLELCSSTAHQSGPFEESSWRVFEKDFIALLEDELYAAKIALFEWNVDLIPCGISLKVHGYSDKLPILLKKILSIVTRLGNGLVVRRFIDLQNEYIETLQRGMRNDDQLGEAEWYLRNLLNARDWPSETAVRIARELKLGHMKKLLSKAFRRISIRGLIHGHCTEKKAKEIVGIIEEPFLSKGIMLPVETLLPDRFVELAEGSHLVHQVLKEDPKIYSYFSYSQLYNDSSDLVNKVAASLLFAIISNKCTLKYILQGEYKDEISSAKCTLSSIRGTRGLLIVVRSNENHTTIDQKVEHFLSTIPEKVKGLSGKSFDSYKKAVECEEDTKSDLSKKSDDYWREIENRSYNFDNNAQIERKALSSLTKQALLDFCEKALDTSSPRRRKLVVHLFPRQTKPNETRQSIPAKVRDK